MDSKDYMSQDSHPVADPLTQILLELQGIKRLERKMDEVSNKFQGELDYLKNELVTMSEARKNDTVGMNRYRIRC